MRISHQIYLRNLITLVFVLGYASVFSQNAKIDSLQQVLSKTVGKEKITVLNDLAKAYWVVDLKKTISLGNEALKLANQYKFYNETAKSYNIIGVAYGNLGNNDLCNKYYDKCLEIEKKYNSETIKYRCLNNKINLYTKGYRNKKFIIKDILDEFTILSIKRKEYEFFTLGLANVLLSHTVSKDSCFDGLKYINNLEKKLSVDFLPSVYFSYAMYYRTIGQEFRAIENIKSILKISSDKNILYQSYMVLGDAYSSIRRFKESKKYYNASLKLAMQINSQVAISYIPILQFKIGSADLELGNFKDARKSILIALNDRTHDFTSFGMCSIYNNLGLAYIGLDSLTKAEHYINRTIYLSDSIHSTPFKLSGFQSKIKLIKKQNRPTQLKETIESIIQIIDSVTDKHTVFEGYQQLTDYYKSTGDYKKSLHYLEKWVIVNDSLKSTESLQIFNEFQTQYETEKKEQQIAIQEVQLKSQRRFLVALSVGGVLLIIALALIIFLYTKRNQAYKRLVLQSIGKTDKSEMFNDNETGDLQNDIPNNALNKIDNQKNNGELFDNETREQIKASLQTQLDAKVYLDESLSINKLAALCNTNRTYLSQIINDTHQSNFNAFINKLRIEEAKNLLLDENLETPLKHLCTQLGFNSYTVFNDAFKRFVGVTPAFFLRTVKAERENGK